MTEPMTDEEIEAIKKEPSHCADWEVLQLIGMVDALRIEVRALRAELKTLLTDLVKADDNALQARREADALKAELAQLTEQLDRTASSGWSREWERTAKADAWGEGCQAGRDEAMAYEVSDHPCEACNPYRDDEEPNATD